MIMSGSSFRIRSEGKLIKLLGGLSVATILVLSGVKEANALCAAPKVPYNFAALWENGSHANYVDVGISDENLGTLREMRHNQNLVIDDIEYTWDAEDARMEWALSWVRGPGFGSIRSSENISEFLSINKTFENGGYRLIDIEYSFSRSGNKWIGLWRKGGSHSVDIKTDLSTRELVRYGNRRHREGWRLFDIERTSSGSVDIWAAVWRNDDNRANYFNVNMTGDEITELTAQRIEDGRYLVDIEAYRGEYGERRYAGIWTTGESSAQSIAGIEEGRLSHLLDQHHRSGLRLIDIEAYEPDADGEIGDVTCNDVILNPVE